MIYLIFGEDTATSRNKLLELTSGKENLIKIDGKKQHLSDVSIALEGDSLFSTKKTVVIDFFTKLKPTKDFLDLVLSHEKDADLEIFLWEADDIDARTKTTLKSVQSFSFSFPKYYYAFLDGFSPRSRDVNMLHQVLQTFEPEQVLYGLTKRVRQLLLLKSSKSAQFSELRSMQGWQAAKLRKQADLWNEKQLQKAFMLLARIDEEIKTGGLTMPLAKHLDILLLSDLN